MSSLKLMFCSLSLLASNICIPKEKVPINDVTNDHKNQRTIEIACEECFSKRDILNMVSTTLGALIGTYITQPHNSPSLTALGCLAGSIIGWAYFNYFEEQFGDIETHGVKINI